MHIYTPAQDNIFTHIWINYNILCIALWACHGMTSMTLLLLIDPSLNTTLMNPFCSASAMTRFNPCCSRVVFISGKAHPTVSPAG